MSRLLLTLSFASLVILAIGTTLFPDYSAFWLASGAPLYQNVRGLLSAILLLLITTQPPRNMILRSVGGLLAVGVSGWALQMTYANHMMLLDSFSILAAAVSIGVTALELRSAPKYVNKKPTTA